MEKQIQEINDCSVVKITRAMMEEELGDAYKRCWALAFKYASDELGFDSQVENLCREFDLFKSQAQWFVNGANSILFKKEIKQTRQANPVKQKELADFAGANFKKIKLTENYVSQLEMMSFLEDIEELSHDVGFAEFWEDLNKLKQKIVEQQCATEKDVLRIFQIRSIAESTQQEEERFFDAYPVTTDAWENGHFDIAGEIIHN
ncbi:MAG: hypothetical protein K8R02_07790 [Anaerohalosphaeraceae bacterium]|nr:hypothetical protein [Anaerohalosphaeraceae bacterium]